MPLNQSYLETEHIPCQPLIGRRLSLEIKNLPMKNSFYPRVRNSEFTAFRPSYRTQPIRTVRKDHKGHKDGKSHAKTPRRKGKPDFEPEANRVNGHLCCPGRPPFKIVFVLKLCAFASLREIFLPLCPLWSSVLGPRRDPLSVMIRGHSLHADKVTA
jgi:hypothetical protein